MIKLYSIAISLIFMLLSGFQPGHHAFAQISRERVDMGMDPVEIFNTQNLGSLSTVKSLGKNNLSVTIMHTFGIVTDRPIENFFGLDFGPNVRLGLDYGISDVWSVGIGRSSRQKVVDIRSRLGLLRQNRSGSVPISISIKSGLGITTLRNGFGFIDRLSYLGSLSFARAFSEHLGVQFSPMYAHFNTVFDPDDPNDLFAVGLGGRYRLSRRYTLFFEYFPVFGDRPSGTVDSFSLGLNIETGGHVFQLFFTSAPWHTEQYVLFKNRDNFRDGDFRFGFNINRLFGLSH